ncbi:hypothetical protein TSOC_009081 [Tetrabaena socialis]|uniref:Uncharacterized protein n=1 Tax=Tetrabaena socialis TaxID=47790 RepID=A0A2J7ZWT6_9CHLO|nr:hypothetical protein TSOC_009081 [Tetrabaena socialis]|eukprot:PNH04741.1 hypothetical protein TSOC_009081 [Tetrabaena socialis]
MAKERYLADVGVWSVVAALVATMGVAFLVLGRSNFSSENNAVSNDVIMYVFIACSVGTIMFNVGAVLVGTVTFALTALVPDSGFVEWFGAREDKGWAFDVWAWVRYGLVSLMASVCSCTYLLYGRYAVVVSVVITVVLYVLQREVRIASLAVFSKLMNKWCGEPPWEGRRSLLSLLFGL